MLKGGKFMIGLIIAGVLGLGAVCSISSAEERSKYMEELRSAKVGKTIARTSKNSVEVFTFSTMQDAIEHPQEITFDPNTCAFNNRETVFLLNCHKQPIEVFDGENFKTVSDSELLTVTDDGNKRYVYLRFKEEKIR